MPLEEVVTLADRVVCLCSSQNEMISTITERTGEAGLDNIVTDTVLRRTVDILNKKEDQIIAS